MGNINVFRKRSVTIFLGENEPIFNDTRFHSVRIVGMYSTKRLMLQNLYPDMFVSVFSFVYTQSPCKLRHLSYRGTSFCMPSSKSSPPSLSASPAERVLYLDHTSSSGLPEIS